MWEWAWTILPWTWVKETPSWLALLKSILPCTLWAVLATLSTTWLLKQQMHLNQWVFGHVTSCVSLALVHTPSQAFFVCSGIGYWLQCWWFSSWRIPLVQKKHKAKSKPGWVLLFVWHCIQRYYQARWDQVVKPGESCTPYPAAISCTKKLLLHLKVYMIGY